MANRPMTIHDIPSEPFPNQQGQGQGQGQGQQQGMMQGQGMGGSRRIMMMGGGDDDGDGGVYPPLNKVLAPNFKKESFIFIVSVVQVIMFIAELLVGQFKYGAAFVKENDMAGPSTETMIEMGAKWLPYIRDGEVYRFITPAFLHAGILHIFTNLVSQTMIGYTCEMNWGWMRMAFFYFMTAFGASLLSSVAAPCVVSVGASGALLGVIGAYMAWILVNWNNREVLRQPCQRMCNMIWWLFIIFMIGISVKGIDNWAHFGGWLTGMMLGFAFCEHTEVVGWMESSQKMWKYGSMLLCVAFYVTTLICSFIVVKGSCL